MKKILFSLLILVLFLSGCIVVQQSAKQKRSGLTEQDAKRIALEETKKYATNINMERNGIISENDQFFINSYYVKSSKQTEDGTYIITIDNNMEQGDGAIVTITPDGEVIVRHANV